MWLGIFSNFSVWVAVINCNEKEVHPRTQTFIYVIREKCMMSWYKQGLMLPWFKDFMNVTEKLQFLDPTFQHPSLVPSSGVI